MANDIVIAKYNARSTNSIVVRAGGRENGTVRVEPEDYSLAQGVKKDYEKDSDMVDFEQGNVDVLSEWIKMTNKTNGKDRDDNWLEPYKDSKDNAKDDMVVGGEKNEYGETTKNGTKASDAENPEKKEGFAASMGGTGTAAAASGIVALATVIAAIAGAKAVGKASSSIPFGAIAAGVIAAALGGLLLTSAIGYDPELNAREAQKDAVDGYISLLKEKEDEISEAMEEHEEYLKEQTDEVSASINEKTDEWLSGEDGVETLQLQLVDISAGKSSENPADIMAKLNAKQAENPIEEDMETMDEIFTEEPTDVYEQYAELDGRQEALNPVQKFLDDGSKEGAWAIAIAALDLTASAMMALFLTQCLATDVRFGTKCDLECTLHTSAAALAASSIIPMPEVVTAETALATAAAAKGATHKVNTIIGCVMIGIGAGLAVSAGGIMIARAVQEFQCANKADELVNGISDSKDRQANLLEEFDKNIEEIYDTSIQNVEEMGETQIAGAEEAFAKTIDNNDDATPTETPTTNNNEAPTLSLFGAGNVSTSSGETTN